MSREDGFADRFVMFWQKGVVDVLSCRDDKIEWKKSGLADVVEICQLAAGTIVRKTPNSIRSLIQRGPV